MLEIIVGLIIIMGALAAIGLASGRRRTMNARAVQEGIKRTNPEDILSQLGEHEFEKAYEHARSKRFTAITIRTLPWAFIGFVLGSLIAIIVSSDNFGLYFLIFMAICGGFCWIGVRKAQVKVPSALDEMRKDPRL